MYTPTEIGQLTDSSKFNSLSTDVVDRIRTILANDAQNKSFKDDLNYVLAAIPGTVPYTSDDQIRQMFIEAGKNGEKDLSNTDKVTLRLFAVQSFGLEKVFGNYGLPALEYNADGTVKWASEVLKPGMSVKDNLVLSINMLSNYNNKTTNAISDINSILPSGLTPYASTDDFKSRGELTGSNTTFDPTTIWLIKFISVGILYIAWIAENKWRLDPNWSMPA